MLSGKVKLFPLTIKGVNLKNLGAFSFEVFSDLVKPAQQSNFDISKDLHE
jgi:hypothetical protein